MTENESPGANTVLEIEKSEGIPKFLLIHLLLIILKIHKLYMGIK